MHQEFESSSLIELTKSMVEIPSITGREKECLEVLDMAADYLGPDFTLTKFEHDGVWSYLFSTGEDVMHPELLLNGHVDVVDAENDEFTPREVDGNILGRGAGDMKGHVAAMLVALKQFHQKHPTNQNLGLLLTTDEEVGGFKGARHVLEQGLRPQRVFTPDAAVNFDIVRSQKAPHHFHIRSLGRGGHASQAFKLDNPIHKILKVYEQMRSKYAVATPELPWASTFEMTVLDSKNTSANRISDQAEAWFSWRWPLEHFSFAEGVTDLQALCEENGCEILPDGHGMGEGFLSDTESAFVQEWKGIIEGILGQEVGFTVEHGASDARHFFAYQIPVLVTSGITGNFHTKNEWIKAESLIQLSKAVYLLLEKNKE